MVCSRIAVRLRQPASTPVTARARTADRLWRTPRRSRGSVMFLRTWARGWRDKAFVVGDDIGAGSQDEGIDSTPLIVPRGPRPRINDTPSPVKTAQTPSPTDFADPLTQDRRASGWTPISSVILRIAPLARAGSASASKVILVARSRSSSGYFLESHGSDPYLASLPPQTPGRFKA